MKKQATQGENICRSCLIKDLYLEYIRNSYDPIKRRKTTTPQIKKKNKTKNNLKTGPEFEQFLKEDTWMANKYIKDAEHH